MTSFIGGALGPYFIGYMSDSALAAGASNGEALRQSLQWSLLAPALGVFFIIFALFTIEADEEGMLERARSLGESL